MPMTQEDYGLYFHPMMGTNQYNQLNSLVLSDLVQPFTWTPTHCCYSTVAIRDKCWSLSCTPESFYALYVLLIHIGYKIFKWSFALNWGNGVKTELSPHHSKSASIFRILSDIAISHNQGREPVFKGYLMSVTSACQKEHITLGFT